MTINLDQRAIEFIVDKSYEFREELTDMALQIAAKEKRNIVSEADAEKAYLVYRPKEIKER